MRLLTVTAVLATLAAATAQAQHPWESAATVEQAIARAIEEAMPEAAYPWSLDWSAFGVRGGRDIFWHLHPPKPYHRWPLPDGVHRRTGWLSVNARSGSVAVCGDADRVGMMSIEVSTIWLGQSDVIAELEARGVSAAPTSESPPLRPLERSDLPGGGEVLIPHGDPTRWRLTKAGLEPVELMAVHRCTPPGTRSATRCSVTWSVLFRPDERRPGAEPCLPPRRPGE